MMEANFGSPTEVDQLWKKIEREKAAGCYPWTHLRTDDEEVWINPLKLPGDLSKDTIKRKDGTLPSEWFHLPPGAETPSVDELLRDSPEPELDLLKTENLNVSEENISISGRQSQSDRKTPCGRKTPIRGKHRHRSSGSSPAPSSTCSRSHVSRKVASPKLQHQRTLSQPEVATSKYDTGTGGYEPVGRTLDKSNTAKSVGKLPQGRPPDSELPNPPSDADDSDTAEDCFRLRKSRSRSKDRSKKISARSISRDSSEHNYETPKLLPKSKLIEDKIPKMELIDYGYEPVGRPPTETQEVSEIKKEDEFGTVHHLSRGNQSVKTNDEKPTTELPSPIENQKRSIFNSFIDKFRNKGDNTEGEKQSKVNDSQNNNQEKEKLEKERRLKIKEIKDAEAKKLKQEEEEEKRQKKVREEEKRILKERQEEEKRLKKEQEAQNKQLRKEKEEEEKRLKKEKEEDEKRQKKEREELEKREKKEKEDEERKIKKLKEEEEKEAKKKKDEEKRQLQEEKNKQQKDKEEDERRKRKIREEEEREAKKSKDEERKRLQEVKAKQQREKEDKKVQLLKEKEDEKMRLKIEKAQQKVAKEQEFKKHQEEKENIQKEIFDKEQEKEKISLKKQKEKFSRKDNLEKELICVKSNKTEPDDVIYADGEFMKDSKRDLLQTPAVPDILTAESTDNQTAESLQAEMALRSRSPGGGGGGYVSVVSNDEMQSFQQNGYHDDEDIDFAPQNGYHYPEDDTEVPRKGKKSGAPKVDLMGKIAAIKNMKIPSPEEIKEGYLNSAFHKSLHQPLMVKAKVEKIDVQKARQAVTQEKTPLQLGNIESLSDIPIPTMRKSKQVQEENAETNGNDEPQEPKTLVETLIPKSLMEQNILTAVKENLDPEELERNQTLTRTKTPAQLAQINSISEFPVPDKIKNLLTSSGAGDKVAPERKKRRHSDIEPKSVEPFSMYSTLPRSLRETKLVTNVKVEEDEETLKARQDLVNTQTPAQLAQICSIADIPVPTRLSKMVTRGQSRSETRASSRAKSSDHVAMASNTTSMSKVNINEMFSTLPKSLTMELAVVSKINKNQDEIEKRRTLCQEKSPAELGNIGSLSDLPIPAPIQNIFFSKTDAPSKPKRNSKDYAEKRKRNLTTGATLPSDFLPESWKETKLLVRSKVEEDEDVLKSRQQLVETKTPAELGAISGLSDLPIPTRIQTLVRPKKRTLKSTEEKQMSKKVSGSAKSLPEMSGFSIPSSLKSELIVTSVVEDPEIVARNKELIKNKSVSELSQIRDIAEFPIPEKIENFFKQKSGPSSVKMTSSVYENGVSECSSERPTSPTSFKDSIYGTLSRSMKEQQLLVNTKLQDQEMVRERQELVRTKSPAELSQISGVNDLPIPTPVENLLKRKSEPGSPVAPPRKWKAEDIYESLPGSLKSELVVRTREMEDMDELERRREVIRTQSPAQLSQIHGFSDIPVPKFIEQKFASKPESVKIEKPTPTETDIEVSNLPLSERIYGTLPASLKDTKLLVKAECEDPEIQAARAEVVKSKSVHELSQVTSLADVPIPDVIENFLKKKEKPLAPAERKKKFKDQMKSQSTLSLSQSLYGSLPRSLKQDLLVKARVEDPDILAERRAIVASKSVSELSQITSLSDIPIPTTLSRAFHKSMERLNGMKPPQPVDSVDDSRPISPGARSIQENLYATLPRSLKSEILVKSVVEDQETQMQNMALTQSKSVSELSQIKSLSEFPIPDRIEKLINNRSDTTNNKNLNQTPEQLSLADSRPMSQASRRGMNDIYASLPRSLTDQLIVRTKVEADEEVLAARQALVESKSPVELSEIHSLAELPIPSRIEAWLSGNKVQENGERSDEASPMILPRNKKELHEAVYRTLPTSLVQPCVVRSKVEDPNILLERQQLQQTKSIHELSKIRNLNEMPVPGNLFTLPDVPLPKVKSLLNIIARPPQRSPRVQNGRSQTYQSYESAQSETPLSTPAVEEREQHDLGYESLPAAPNSSTPPPPPPPAEDEDDQFNLADQIRATPERSLKGKKKKNRRSHEIHEDMVEDVPPPLPPKKLSPSPIKGLSLERQPSEEEEIEAIPVKGILTLEAVDGNIQVVRKEAQSGSHEPREISEKMSSPQVEERIQSRPLPAPPAPPRNMKKKSASIEESEGRASRNSDRSYGDVTCTENFRTCADTLNTSKTLRAPSSRDEDDITLAESVVDSLVSCAETLVDDNDNMETCVDTLTGGDEFLSDEDVDNPYPSVNFDRAGASIMEEDRPGRSMDKKRDVKKSESGRRLEEGTQQLSLELMHHVESLKTTLDNMSNRLGTRSRSRSHSKTRNNNKDSL